MRFGPPPDSRVMARKIANHRRRIFASPVYLKDRPRPVVPDDLTQHNCLIVRQDDVAYGQWHFTKTRSERESPGNLSSNDGAAVLTGTGDTESSCALNGCRLSVQDGQLEILLDDYALPPANIYAVYPQETCPPRC